MRRSPLAALPWLCFIGLTACKDDPKPDDAPSKDGVDAEVSTGNDAGSSECTEDAIECEGSVVVTCTEGEAPVRTDCAEQDLTCARGLGCRACSPGAVDCDGDTVRTCSADGSEWLAGEVCDGAAGVHCDAASGSCRDLCQEAVEAKSYVGCEYWPTTMYNVVDKQFDYAVIVSNPQSVAAELTISAEAEQGGSAAFELTETVAPRSVKPVRLPWRLLGADEVPLFSGTAYHLVSSVPVIVYQFSPLEYRVDQDCTLPENDPDPLDGSCYSYTNDASLVLPTSSLTANYILLSIPAQGMRRRWTDTLGQLLVDGNGDPAETFAASASAFAVTAAEQSTVSVTPTAPAIYMNTRYSAGETFSLELNAGQVAQVFFEPPADFATCSAGESSRDTADVECGAPPFPCIIQDDACQRDDPSGTLIQATGKVAVYAGTPCSNVPYNRRACDHLEEALPPLETWGKQVLVGVTKPLDGEPNLFRIISGADGNTLTFLPASVHAPVELAAGEVVELVSKQSFEVSATEPILVGQFLVGQDYAGLQPSYDRGEEERAGDPSLSFVAPSEQFRMDYSFLTPSTYAESWVTLTGPSRLDVDLDGTTLSDWDPIGDSDYGVMHVKLEPGPHTIRTAAPVGAQVYGFGSYTSYMFPAGLDLNIVNLL